MRNAGLEEAQATIKIARRNISNLRCRWHHSYGRKWRETEKPFVESEKVALKLNIQKTKITASSPITSWEIDGKTVETVADFIFWGSKITADSDCSHQIKRHILLGRKVMTNLDSILKSREKCKSKPQWGTISQQSEWLWSKSPQAINAGEGVEKREPSYTVGGNAPTRTATMEKSVEIP